VLRSLARLQYHADGARLGVRGVLALAYRHERRRLVMVIVDATAQVKVWVDDTRAGEWLARVRLGDVVVVSSCACYYSNSERAAAGARAYVTSDSTLSVFREDDTVPESCKALMAWGKREFPSHAIVAAIMDEGEKAKVDEQQFACESIDAVVESTRDCVFETDVLILRAWRRQELVYVEVMDADPLSRKGKCICMIAPQLANDMMLHDDELLEALNAGIHANSPLHMRIQFKIQLDSNGIVQIRHGLVVHAELWSER
jgi:hypothetical protein